MFTSVSIALNGLLSSQDSVEKVGMVGKLAAFLQAGFSSTSSVVLLNGRPCEAIPLRALILP